MVEVWAPVAAAGAALQALREAVTSVASSSTLLRVIGCVVGVCDWCTLGSRVQGWIAFREKATVEEGNQFQGGEQCDTINSHRCVWQATQYIHNCFFSSSIAPALH